MSSLYFLAPTDADALPFVGHLDELPNADHVNAHDLIRLAQRGHDRHLPRHNWYEL
nr:hypothetical protein [Propionibacterium sp.]